MKKFYLCKLCLIVFGALLAVQTALASPYKKLWESLSDGVTEMVSGKAGLLVQKKYCKIPTSDDWFPLVEGRVIVNGRVIFTLKPIDGDFVEVRSRDGRVFVLPVTEGVLSSYEAKFNNGHTLLHCSDIRATVKFK